MFSWVLVGFESYVGSTKWSSQLKGQSEDNRRKAGLWVGLFED